MTWNLSLLLQPFLLHGYAEVPLIPIHSFYVHLLKYPWTVVYFTKKLNERLHLDLFSNQMKDLLTLNTTAAIRSLSTIITLSNSFFSSAVHILVPLMRVMRHVETVIKELFENKNIFQYFVHGIDLVIIVTVQS